MKDTSGEAGEQPHFEVRPAWPWESGLLSPGLGFLIQTRGTTIPVPEAEEDPQGLYAH